MISITPLSANQPPFDIILISGDYYADHPHSGIGVIAKVLEGEGFRIGIIEKPDWTDLQAFLSLGLPRLCWGISSGLVDSMLQNYTPLKNPRINDPYKPYNSHIPDRAVIVYSQKVKQAEKWAKKNWESNKLQHISEKSIPIILGGVEASLRRFMHYDYWDNALRRPILFDAKADILVYGSGEYQIKTIAHRLNNDEDLHNIEGTCRITKNPPDSFRHQPFTHLPSDEAVRKDKKAFCKMHLAFSNQVNLCQQVGSRYLIQYKMHHYTSSELDAVYDLPFSYDIPVKYPELKMAQYSINTHRGCFGNCNFCSIRLHQGNKITSRSIPNILAEIKKIASLPGFPGFIGDLGGPSANMYGMDCEFSESCQKECLECSLYKNSHEKVTELLIKSRKIPKIKKILVRSGIRYDLAVDEEKYLKELSQFHISGNLKIAPEHFSPRVCALINKDNSRFEEFKEKFDKLNRPLGQFLKYYFITAHPGSTMDDAYLLRDKIRNLGYKNTESVQIFTPTPMSISTCMYYTGLNPYTMEPIYIPYSYNEKKKQKRILYPRSRTNKP